MVLRLKVVYERFGSKMWRFGVSSRCACKICCWHCWMCWRFMRGLKFRMMLVFKPVCIWSVVTL